VDAPPETGVIIALPPRVEGPSAEQFDSTLVITNYSKSGPVKGGSLQFGQTSLCGMSASVVISNVAGAIRSTRFSILPKRSSAA
jgi:hypothetical protein